MGSPQPYVTPRDRLHRVFAVRAAMPPALWHARVWLRAVLMTPGGDPAAVADRLRAEWASYQAEHPGEPDITFAPFAPLGSLPDEPVVPGPPPVDDLAPLRFGRYGLDLPSHDDRVREEQERLARRDAAHYGF